MSAVEPDGQLRRPAATGSTASSRRAVVLCNPVAGRGRGAKALPAVEHVLRDGGLRFRSVVTTSIEHALEEADAAARSGVVVAALGGDGLVGRVADVVSRAGGVLAVLPGGRGNDFARAVGLPGTAVEAAHALLDGEPLAHDLGEVENAQGRQRRFLGICSVGIDSEVQRIADTTRLPLGRATYAYAALVSLRSWRPLPFTVKPDGSFHRFRGFTVAVANSGIYGGGMRLAPDARMDDGELDLVRIAGSSKFRLLRSLARMPTGGHVDDPHVTIDRVREVTINSTSPLALRLVAYADGEPVAPLPLRIRSIPAALQVLSPPTSG